MRIRKIAGYIVFVALMQVSVVNIVNAQDFSPETQAFLKNAGVTEKDLKPSPVAGLYELQSGSRIYYLSKDGQFLVIGNLIDIQTNKNLTEERMGGIRAESIAVVGDDRLVAFNAEKTEHTVTVFTDIDCGYCRKLHSEMDQYNKLGISVKYLFYPRAGIGSDSYKKAVSVWCSKDRHEALTRAKSGEPIRESNCDNPVSSHFLLGEEIGIRGTPAIITEAGELLSGYMPPANLRRELDQLRSEQTGSNKLSRK